ARIVEAVTIEPVLPPFESARKPRAKHRLVELRAHQPIAMLARVRTFVFAHHRERLFGDLAHGMHVFLLAQIQDWSHMQASGTRMRIPGAARSVLFKNLREARGVFGEM